MIYNSRELAWRTITTINAHSPKRLGASAPEFLIGRTAAGKQKVCGWTFAGHYSRTGLGLLDRCKSKPML